MAKLLTALARKAVVAILPLLSPAAGVAAVMYPVTVRFEILPRL